MKLVLVLCFFLININGFAKSPCLSEHSGQKLKQCPVGLKRTPLGNHHVPRAIFLGLEQHGNSDNSDYLARMIQLIDEQDLGIKINLVLPKQIARGKKTKALKNILKKYEGKINLVSTEGRMPSWIQDPMEFYYNQETENNEILSLPYSRSPNIASDIAKGCGWDSQKIEDAPFNGGNHGGNVEHLFDDKVMVGDSSTEEIRSFLSKQKLDVVSVPTQWLYVGHADEIILPIQGKNGCSTHLLYASPLKALELLGYRRGDNSCNLILIKNLKPIGFRTKRDCESLLRASVVYENLVSNSVKKIQALKSCVGSDPVPTIFFPEKLHRKKLGTNKDRAKSILPNPVNSVILGKLVIAPWQRVKAFEHYIVELMEKHNLKAKFVKNKMVHWNGGNVHCTTNVLRQCR